MSNTNARSIQLESFSNQDVEETTHAQCNLLTSYIDGQVICDNKDCAVVSVRKSTLPHNSTNLSSLDLDWVNTYYFFKGFVNSTGIGHDATSSPLEAYFKDPDLPFSSSLQDWSPIYPIGNRLFAQRFTQLLNTYYIGGINPGAITGDFSSANVTGYTTETTTGALQTNQIVLKCNKGWLTVLVAVSLVMLLMGLAGTILGLRRHGPDVLDSFSSAIRNNPYVELPNNSRVSSMDDGVDFSRKIRSLKVKLGDVCAEKEIGRVAIGSIGNRRAGVMRLKKQRLYE